MAQHAILRFEKHKGNPARPLEAHHERQKEQYASNPDIDTSRSKYNFHIVNPEGRYYHFIQNRIEQAGCRTRRDSTRFVDTLITASPEFFKKKSPKEIQAFFQRAADFLIGRVGKENIVSAVVHMDEKTPHLHLVFVPLTEDNRLCAKEIIGNRANLTKWQDDFHAYMVEKYPNLERGESGNVKKCAVGKHPKSEKLGGIGSGCRLRLRPLPVLHRRQSQRVARIDPNAVVVDKNIAENDRFDLFSR